MTSSAERNDFSDERRRGDRCVPSLSLYLGKGQLVCVGGWLRTRQWSDSKLRHWKTEIVASPVEMRRASARIC
jgi:single-stranded DNA-binding protein